MSTFSLSSYRDRNDLTINLNSPWSKGRVLLTKLLLCLYDRIEKITQTDVDFEMSCVV